MAIEEPKFITLKKDGAFTLREYAPLLLAETVVEGNFEEVSSQGFRILAGYIFGANQGAAKIAMTAPVNLMEAKGDKIKMTAPVNLELASKNSWRITFTMPAEYTMESIPKPRDQRVFLKQIAAQTQAALVFSGTWSQDRFDKQKNKLLSWIKSNGLEPAGEAVFARYNPPWTPWFLRRNEVLIPVLIT